MGGMAAAVALGAVLWGAGAASAWLVGHRVPHGKPLAGYAAFGHFGDPSRAWSAPVGPAILYWTITFLVLAVAGIVCWGGWKLWHYEPSAKGGDPALLDGMATASQVRRAAGAKVVAETVGDAASILAPAPSRRCRLPAGLLEGSGVLGERGGLDPPLGSAPLR